METKQPSYNPAPRWAVRLKRELKEMRQARDYEAREKEMARLFIVNAGQWDAFKEWASRNKGLKEFPSSLVFDIIDELRKQVKENYDDVVFWREMADANRKTAHDALNMCDKFGNTCDIFKKAYEETKQKLNKALSRNVEPKTEGHGQRETNKQQGKDGANECRDYQV